MKAVRMYAPGDLRVEEAPRPVPGPGEYLVQVMAVGVCGSDIPRVNRYGAHVSPIIVGHEFSGLVVEAGPGAQGFEPGDHVTCPPLIPCGQCPPCRAGQYSLCEQYDYYGSRRDGAFAQYIAVKAENLLKVAPQVSFEDAATLDPCANAMHGLRRAQFAPGDSLCVYGAGPIGQLALRCAAQMGASQLMAVDVWDEKLALAQSGGAPVLVNSRRQDPVQASMEATGGQGAQVVIDFSGVPDCQQAAILSAARMGRVVYLGISHQGLNLSEKAVDALMRRQITLAGSWNSFTAPFPGPDWTQSLDLFQQGKITSKDLISHRLSLDEAPAIFRRIAQGGFYFNKIMFFPNGLAGS